MSKVVNIIGKGSNVGKTILMEGLICELKARGYSVATIKHDCHGFEIDHKGKDTYKHRMAGSETVIISSATQFAMIREQKQEMMLEELIEFASDKDIILVEGYKNSLLRKIEVIRQEITTEVISPKDLLIAIASDIDIAIEGVEVVSKADYEKIADLIEQEEVYSKEGK